MTELNIEVQTGKAKATRIVMTENEALAILNRNKIKIEYPKIILPKAGPGLKCWAAIDCLTNRVKPKYFAIGYPRTQEVKP